MRRRSGLVVGAWWLVVAACSGGDASKSSTESVAESARPAGATAATPSPTTDTTTTQTRSTERIATSTEVAEPTTSVTAEVSLELRAEGLGDLEFGALPEVLIETVGGDLGAPLTDDAVEFPEIVGGSFENGETVQAFSAPFGRTVCWPGLCAYFGGDDPSTVSFVGWDFVADRAGPPPPLRASGGLTLGSRWSDFLAVMSVQPGGCRTSGSGTTTGGIDLALAGPFSAVSDSGEYVELLPDPSQVIVVGMRAGSQVVSLEEDC